MAKRRRKLGLVTWKAKMSTTVFPYSYFNLLTTLRGTRKGSRSGGVSKDKAVS